MAIWQAVVLGRSKQARATWAQMPNTLRDLMLADRLVDDLDTPAVLVDLDLL